MVDSKPSEQKLKNLPNFVTCLRIVGTTCLLFIKPESLWFYVVYLFSGATDIVDGFIARKMGLTSALGAKLDSIADLLFYAVMLLRIFPRLLEVLPMWIWICVAVVLAVRISAYIVAAVKYKRFASLHTYLNKVTGGAVFAVPFIMLTSIATALCAAVCAIGFLASLEELIIHISNDEYKSVKSMFQL